MTSKTFVSFIIVLTSIRQAPSHDSNTLEWKPCNQKVDDCMAFIVAFAPKIYEAERVGFCHTLTAGNIHSLRRTGEASSRPCGPPKKRCVYQKVQFGVTDLQLNCTLQEGFQDIHKYLPGVRILSSPPSIPDSFARQWGANSYHGNPPSLIAHWKKLDIRVEVKLDHDDDQYPIIESEVISDHNALTVWCEGSAIFKTLCKGASGHQKTRLSIGNLVQIFVKKMLPDEIKNFGSQLTTCRC